MSVLRQYLLLEKAHVVICKDTPTDDPSRTKQPWPSISKTVPSKEGPPGDNHWPIKYGLGQIKCYTKIPVFFYENIDPWLSQFTSVRLCERGLTSWLLPAILQLCACHHYYHPKCWTSQPKISGTHPGIRAFHHHMEPLLLIPRPPYSSSRPSHTYTLFLSLLLFIDYWHEELKLASDLCS